MEHRRHHHGSDMAWCRGYVGRMGCRGWRWCDCPDDERGVLAERRIRHLRGTLRRVAIPERTDGGQWRRCHRCLQVRQSIGRSLPDQRIIGGTVHGRHCVQFKTQWDIRVGSGIRVLPTLVRTPHPWRTVRSLVCGTKIPGFGQVGSSGERSVPGLVRERPRGDNLACSGARWRSMVAALIETNGQPPRRSW